MKLVETAKRLVRGTDDTVYRYQCVACESEFESPTADMSQVRCDQCGSRTVRAVASGAR